MTGFPVPLGWQPAQSDWDSAGTALGTLPANSSSTPVQTVLQIPATLLLASGPSKTGPTFRPQIALRFAGQEPPPGRLSQPAACVYGDSGTTAGWGASNSISVPFFPELYFHEKFPPLQWGTATHIGNTMVDILPWQKQVLAQRAALADQKLAIQQEIERQNGLKQEALNLQKELQQSATNALTAVASLQAQVNQYVKLEGELPPAVQSKIQLRNTLAQDIDQLNDQIADAKAAGQNTTALTKKLTGQQKALAAVQEALVGKLGPLSDAEQTLRGRLGSALTHMATISSQLSQVVAIQDLVESNLAGLNRQMSNVDKSMDDLGAKVADPDFRITRVTATATAHSCTQRACPPQH